QQQLAADRGDGSGRSVAVERFYRRLGDRRDLLALGSQVVHGDVRRDGGIGVRRSRWRRNNRIAAGEADRVSDARRWIGGTDRDVHRDRQNLVVGDVQNIEVPTTVPGAGARAGAGDVPQPVAAGEQSAGGHVSNAHRKIATERLALAGPYLSASRVEKGI